MIERLPGVNQNKIFLESSLVLQSVLVVKNKESFNVLSLKRHSSRVKYSDTRLNVKLIWVEILDVFQKTDYFKRKTKLHFCEIFFEVI